MLIDRTVDRELLPKTGQAHLLTNRYKVRAEHVVSGILAIVAVALTFLACTPPELLQDPNDTYGLTSRRAERVLAADETASRQRETAGGPVAVVRAVQIGRRVGRSLRRTSIGEKAYS